jgi:hypothetical protein
MNEVDIKQWKKDKLTAIRDYHKDLINDLGISVSDFNMKKSFRDKHGREVVGIFSSEFERSKGFFFELITSDLDPEDPERKVYRVPPNPNYEEEYEINQKNSYNVPLEELRVINPYSAAISKFSSVVTPEKTKEKTLNIQRIEVPLEDAPYSEMTIRDYMAIHTGKPVSQKAWLNELVKSSK